MYTVLIMGLNPPNQLPLLHFPTQRCSSALRAGLALATPTSPVDLPRQTGKGQPRKPIHSSKVLGHSIPARIDIDVG